MVFEGLRNAISNFLKRDRYEDAVNEFIREMQKELLKSDVNVKLVAEITERIKKRALEEEPPLGVPRRHWFLTIVYEELVRLLGGERKPSIRPSKKPWVILLVGLQGSGKTTTAAKIANFYKFEGFKVGLVAADTYRPAAYDQLKQLGDLIGVPVYGDPNCKDAVKIAIDGVKYFAERGFDVIIIDTAGRHHKEDSLLEEMRQIYMGVNPDEIMLVLDASTGQQAYTIAKKFHETTPIGSIVLTKLDGTARGGGALSAVAITGATIKFIGTGEKIDEIELFNPPKFVARILGLGDIEGLIESVKRARIEFTEKDLEEMLEGKINMRLIYKQITNLRKLGPLRRILQMIPGLGVKIPFEIDSKELEEKIEKWIAIINSMTYEELDNPDIIDKSRMKRIARGAGVDVEDVKDLLKQYELLKKLTRRIKKSDLKKLEKLGIDLSKLEELTRTK
ncbi:MAG: signal recognition particle protein Srp54 [Desulfurococcaceae archaeon]|jgi:signal recognition particle subunit SRP54|nr:signal recognition particle protein Srp54 [Desulfurococcaceae archaeon]